jgi:hypothetical protein
LRLQREPSFCESVFHPQPPGPSRQGQTCCAIGAAGAVPRSLLFRSIQPGESLQVRVRVELLPPRLLRKRQLFSPYDQRQQFIQQIETIHPASHLQRIRSFSLQDRKTPNGNNRAEINRLYHVMAGDAVCGIRIVNRPRIPANSTILRRAWMEIDRRFRSSAQYIRGQDQIGFERDNPFASPIIERRRNGISMLPEDSSCRRTNILDATIGNIAEDRIIPDKKDVQFTGHTRQFSPCSYRSRIGANRGHP